mmetsp:Transcript_43192/g.85768  ORF Transcript_43192/g.85768 Transcript_43192/m.85768 type:complete len:205 (+) Transcript_43192:154-768(+)
MARPCKIQLCLYINLYTSGGTFARPTASSRPASKQGLAMRLTPSHVARAEAAETMHAKHICGNHRSLQARGGMAASFRMDLLAGHGDALPEHVSRRGCMRARHEPVGPRALRRRSRHATFLAESRQGKVLGASQVLGVGADEECAEILPREAAFGLLGQPGVGLADGIPVRHMAVRERHALQVVGAAGLVPICIHRPLRAAGCP